MAEFQDYSGEFRPNIKYQDFSKEALARLLAEHARLGLALEGWWHTTGPKGNPYSCSHDRYKERHSVAGFPLRIGGTRWQR